MESVKICGAKLKQLLVLFPESEIWDTILGIFAHSYQKDN